MEIPKLKSERVELVPLSMESESAYIRFYSDAEASKLYGGPKSASEAFSRLLMDAGSWHVLGFGVWAIKSLELEKIVGVCGFWQGKGWPIELTWWLLPEARGKGLAQEASKLAIRHAYDCWKWSAVETYMTDDNEPARKLVLALGGRFVRRQLFPDGLERNLYLFPQDNFSRRNHQS